MAWYDWLLGRSGEERASLRRPTDWLYTALTGGATASGETVTADSALRQPIVWACVRVIAEDVASLPLKVYGRRDDGGREEITTHPVARLLHTEPNVEMSPFTFMETLTSHVLLYGNAYVEIERNGAGHPVALWPLIPERMTVLIIDGEITYEYRGAGLGSVQFTRDKIIHVKGLGSDGVMGYSPIAYARETIGMAKAMEKSGGSFFANSSRPSGVLSHPGRLTEDASRRLRQSWDTVHTGSANTGRTAVLEEGMKWQTLSIPNQDSQWLEARQFALQDICRIYRVPPHLVQDLSRATFSNIESQQIAYLQHTLMPWLRRWEQELTRKLLPGLNGSMYVEFLSDAVLRGNTTERFDAYKTARETGWLSINEIRRRENLNPIDGGDGYIQPLNFSVVGSDPPVEEADGEGERSAESRQQYEDVEFPKVVVEEGDACAVSE